MKSEDYVVLASKYVVRAGKINDRNTVKNFESTILHDKAEGISVFIGTKASDFNWEKLERISPVVCITTVKKLLDAGYKLEKSTKGKEYNHYNLLLPDVSESTLIKLESKFDKPVSIKKAIEKLS